MVTFLDSPMPSFIPSNLVQRQETKEKKNIVTIDTSLLRDSTNSADDNILQTSARDI